MRVERREVKVFRKAVICDCGTEMVPTGKSFPVYPMLYEYECENCGVVSKTRETGLGYEDIEPGISHGE